MKSNEITVLQLQDNLQKALPEFIVSIIQEDNVGDKEILKVDIVVEDQATISFHQIKNFFDTRETEGQDSVELLEVALLAVVEMHLRIYGKLDKIQILKDGTSIVKLEDAEPTSFHKLKEDEMINKMKIYELEEKDFVKKED